MIRSILGALAAWSLATVAVADTVPAQRFVDPVSARNATLSPDGNFIAYIARTENDQRVIVMDLAAQQAHAIQTVTSTSGSVDWLVWKGSTRLVMGVTVHEHIEGQAPIGSRVAGPDAEIYMRRVVAIDRDGSHIVSMFQSQIKMLSWGAGDTALEDPLPADPTHVLIAANDNEGNGIWLADVNTGRVQRVADGSDFTVFYATDINGAAVMREDVIPDGSGYRYYRRAPSGGAWTFVREARRVEAVAHSPDFEIVASGPAPGKVYVTARTDNAEYASLYLFDTATGELGAPIHQSETADAATPWLSRTTRQTLATCEFAQRLSCHASDPRLQRNLEAIDGFFDHSASIELVDMSEDGGKWLLYVDGPTQSAGYYLYEMAIHRVSPVVEIYPKVPGDALSPTQVVSYQARDGAPLWAYVTAKEGVSGPRPVVVFPHGGPEVRDYYGYDGYVQFLASRGYVVVQPNFRGGTGFGRSFADAGRGQWGLRMQNDVTDAVQHLIQTGVADPARICIVGSSYGGYAALEGAASTPSLYKCAISISGVSDLREMLHVEVHAGRSSPNYQYWLHSIGDPRQNADAIAAASPALHADQITAPVLLIHGETDDIVPIRQAEIMSDALARAGHPTRLVRLPHEGHHWDDWTSADRLTLFQESETFLAQNLGPAH